MSTSEPDPLPLQKFEELRAEWKRGTLGESDLDAICMHPAYQQIIGMGEHALPFICREMNEHSGDWFWALKAITGDDPVLEEDRGQVKRMAEVWLSWAKDHGFD
ncbi:MAG: hypothetical protein HY360_22910 [Verrucomicrobia bacterium]|nr:hypothetical protein [Verrucomicrobiota bacterium]